MTNSNSIDDVASRKRKELCQSVNHLIDDLYIINEYFDGYIALYNKQVTDVDTLNRTPGFFQLVMHAFLNQFVAIMCRMYENNDRNNPISLFTLIRNFEKYGDCIIATDKALQNAITEYKSLLNNQKDSIDKLKMLRDKSIMHNDNKGLDNNFWIASNLTIGTYQSLIKTAHEALCIVSNILEIPTPLLGMGITSDIDYLIATMRRGSDVD